MNFRHTKLAPLAAAAMVVATAVLANGTASASITDTQARSVTVRYDPRDLNAEKGAEHLLSRISSAASKVCDQGGSLLQFIESSGYRNCFHDAIAGAVTAVNRPTLTAAYDRRFAQTAPRGLHADLGLRPVVEIQMVAVGNDVAAPATEATL